MNAIVEFPEDYEPSSIEVITQAGRRLRFHDRSEPNSLIGITRVPFEDDTTMDFEFYKPAVFEHKWIPYNVLLSTVIRCSITNQGRSATDIQTYDGGDEGALSDLKIYLILENPNKPTVHYAYFTITDYGTKNQLVSKSVLLHLDDIMEHHEEAYDLFNFLYDYGMDGVAMKED